MSTKKVYYVNCIKTDNTNKISCIGGKQWMIIATDKPNHPIISDYKEHWTMDVDEVISAIESKTHSFYIGSHPGPKKLIIVKGESDKYIRALPDNKEQNNLSSLPECNKI